MEPKRYYFTVEKVAGGYALTKSLFNFYVTENLETLLAKIRELLENPEKIPE